MDSQSRRRFLCGAAASLALAAGGTLARPTIAATMAARPRRLSLSCPETGECFDDVYWANGDYLPGALTQLDWLLRDFHRDAVRGIDPGLLDVLARLSGQLGGRQLVVFSAYRSRETQAMLRREGLTAARQSMHLVGRAADVTVEDVPLRRLYHAASAMQAGGVGFYPRQRFVHVDTGAVRTWYGSGVRSAAG